MNARIADVSTAILLILFSLLMKAQLAHIPREGMLFPMSVLTLLMICSALMGLRALLAGQQGTMTFFGKISPLRWTLVVGIFFLQVLGSMYVSFFVCMAIGMLVLLLVLAPTMQPKSLLCALVFTLALSLFFQLFFTSIMHIYFPEPFWG